MRLTVETCFSQLRAFMGGTDARYNDNQGIGRECEAVGLSLQWRRTGVLHPACT